MIRSWLTFAREAEALQEAFSGRSLNEAWTQEANRLHLAFDPSYDVVEISLDLQVGYAIALSNFRRARRNTLDLFSPLVGSELEGVEMIGSERAMRFDFGGAGQLDVAFYGAGSGNAYLRREGGVLDALREIRDGEQPPQATDEELPDRATLQQRLVEMESRSLRRSLTRALPLLGKRLTIEAIHSAGLDPKQKAVELSDDEFTALFVSVDRLWEMASLTEQFYLYTSGPREEPIFSLVPLRDVPGGYGVTEHDSISSAIRAFRYRYYSTQRFRERYRRLEGRLAKEIDRLERLIENSPEPEIHLERADRMEATANLLLANLHCIERGVDQVELEDWSGESSSVVRLDPKLSPAENADRYYRKARGARMESEMTVERVRDARQKLARYQELSAQLSTAENLLDLESIEQDGGDLFVKKGKRAESGSADRFRHFRVEGNLDVFAGKNASNNDELTMRFAKPGDYWFHARGSSGSHVVLRWTDRKHRPPKGAIEAAARVAAFYSGARGSSLVPVAYTQKKYVRKPKGAAPGSVTMSREEVIMVPPELPGGSGQSVKPK